MGTSRRRGQIGELQIHPVTASRWPELVEFFERAGPRGAWSRPAACYCMFWRLESVEYEKNFRQRSMEAESGGPNKSLMANRVAGGAVPGLLASRADRPVGWVSVSPRSQLVRLQTSAQLRSEHDTGDEKTWSISCFYVNRSEWRTGVGTALLDAAVKWAREHGAGTVEGYPVKAGSVDPYTGYDTMFARAGFKLDKPGRGKGRALWRLSLKAS